MKTKQEEEEEARGRKKKRLGFKKITVHFSLSSQKHSSVRTLDPRVFFRLFCVLFEREREREREREKNDLCLHRHDERGGPRTSLSEDDDDNASEEE